MDSAGTTSGTIAKPTGWYPNYHIFPPAQKILIVASSQGKQTPAAARQRWAHSAAQSRLSPVHRRRHRRPFLSKSKHARNHPSGGPERAGRIRFSLAAPKGGGRGIYIYILLRSVYLWCLQSYTSPEYGHIFTPDHWACYEQLRRKMKVLKIVSIKLESNKHVTISHVLYFFWQLLYETKSGLRVDRIMSNHYFMHVNFALDFKRNYWTQ